MTDVRVAVRAGCGGGATHRPVSAQLCADSRWRVGGANCGGVGRASYVRNLLCVDLGKCPRTGLANSRGRGAVGGRRGAMPTQRTDSHGARGPRWADAVRAQAGRGAGRAAGGRARRGAGWRGVKADTLPARSQHIPRELFSMHGRERCPRNQQRRCKVQKPRDVAAKPIRDPIVRILIGLWTPLRRKRINFCRARRLISTERGPSVHFLTHSGI